MRVRNHANPFSYTQRMSHLDIQSVVPSFVDTLDVEIGFGRGIFLRQYAKQNPKRPILGIELRQSMVEILQERITNEGIQNVGLVHGPGQTCLEDVVPDHSIDRLFIFHPDPWLKKSHHKRRLLNTSFLKLIHQKLSRKGVLYVSTDVSELWQEIESYIQSSPLFRPQKNDTFFQTCYTSHWDQYSHEDNRHTFSGSFAPHYQEVYHEIGR
ncbi:MAG: tRNA (guanosine(46)-N7)-methyltransferase TrmB [Candidatus Margulisbacteria bacterium]|nr:tRNA (guanosine(46)-N7)-methyltransferase TrmB [Candidatus Margulisiibacteriota bacterium]